MAVKGQGSHLILSAVLVSDALDMAETSLTSLSDDLKDRLSLIWRQKTFRQASEGRGIKAAALDYTRVFYLSGVLHHTCRDIKRSLV